MKPEDAIERERLVAYIDLLGYRAVLKGVTLFGHDDIWKLRRPNDRAWEYIKAYYQAIDDVFGTETFEYLRLIGFSDSIFIIVTAADNGQLEDGEVYAFCRKLQELLDRCLADHLPIRGGVSIGSVKADRDIGKSSLNYLAGLAVSQAVRMEEMQEWVGVSFVSPTDLQDDQKPRYCSLMDRLSRQTPLVVLRWDVPTKRGLEATYVVPCRNLTDSIASITGSRDFEKLRSSSEADKYRGTLALLRALQDEWGVGGDEQDCQSLTK